MDTLSWIALFYLIVIGMLAACIVQALLLRKILKVLQGIRFILTSISQQERGDTIQYTEGDQKEVREPYKIIQKREPTDKIEDDGNINDS